MDGEAGNRALGTCPRTPSNEELELGFRPFLSELSGFFWKLLNRYFHLVWLGFDLVICTQMESESTVPSGGRRGTGRDNNREEVKPGSLQES